MAKKSKASSKKSKKDAVAFKYPPPVIYKTWPGKIDDPTVLAAKHSQLKNQQQMQTLHDLVTL